MASSVRSLALKKRKCETHAMNQWFSFASSLWQSLHFVFPKVNLQAGLDSKVRRALRIPFFTFHL
jgi:hypothetical protein